VIPLAFNVATFSLCCIVAGSYRSMFQMCDEFKKCYVTKDGNDDDEKIEVMSKKEAL